MAKTIVGLFEREETARNAADALKSAGFDPSDVEYVKGGEKKEEGFFSWLTGNEEARTDSPYYAEGIRRGHIMVAVHSDARADDARDILSRFGPIDLHAEGERWRREGWSAGGEDVVPVVQEEMEVGKRDVSKGGLRVYTHVSERPVSERVTLRDETVNVERHPVDRPATAADEAFKERSIEMEETDEKAVVSKTDRVIEEVRLSKDTEEHEERVDDTVRRTDVEVEKTPPGHRPS